MKHTPGGMPEKLYRYRIFLHHFGTEFSRGGIVLLEFTPVRHTKCGVYIRKADDSVKLFRNTAPERFVLTTSGRKRYAYPTKKEAWESLVARKRKRIEHLTRQFEIAQRKLDIVLTAIAKAKEE